METNKRHCNYKNYGKDKETMRKKRRKVCIRLRKDKRYQDLEKRRTFINNSSSIEDINSDEDVSHAIEQHKKLKTLVAFVLNTENEEQRFDAVQRTRVFLPSVTAKGIIARSGIIPALIDCLKLENSEALQTEACWTLVYLMTDRKEHIGRIVSADAVKHLSELLLKPVSNLKNLVLRALGSIMSCGTEYRQFVLASGIVATLFELATQENVSVSLLQTIGLTYYNICHSDSGIADFIHQIVPGLCLLLKHTDVIVLLYATRSISSLAEMGVDEMNLLIDSDIVPSLDELLGNANNEVQAAALQVIAQISSGTDAQRELVINNNVLSYFPVLLAHPTEAVRNEAIKVICQLAAGTQSQIQDILNAQLLPILIENLGKGGFRTQKKACKAIRNIAVNGNREQVLELITTGAVTPFCKLLGYMDTDVIWLVLEGVENMLHMSRCTVFDVNQMLETCCAWDKIDIMVFCINDDISEKARQLIDKYHTHEKNEDINLTSNTTEMDTDLEFIVNDGNESNQ